MFCLLSPLAAFAADAKRPNIVFIISGDHAWTDHGCSPAAGIAKLEAQRHHPSAALRGYKSDIWDDRIQKASKERQMKTILSVGRWTR